MVDKREIRAERIRRGMTQEDMAEYLGLKFQNYQAREAGRVLLSDRDKAAITKLFGWSYKQMNRFLYDGVLPDFYGPDITER